MMENTGDSTAAAVGEWVAAVHEAGGLEMLALWNGAGLLFFLLLFGLAWKLKWFSEAGKHLFGVILRRASAIILLGGAALFMLRLSIFPMMHVFYNGRLEKPSIIESAIEEGLHKLLFDQVFLGVPPVPAADSCAAALLSNSQIQYAVSQAYVTQFHEAHKGRGKTGYYSEFNKAVAQDFKDWPTALAALKKASAQIPADKQGEIPPCLRAANP